MKLLTRGASCSIQPSDINTGRHPHETFGRHETEISAQWLVRLCQARGSWDPFNMADLEEFYTPGDGFWFNDLDTQGYVVVKHDVVTLTEEFVKRYHDRYPA